MAERAARTRANAVINVDKYEPSAYDEPAEGPVLTRIHVEERFSGDISGAGVVEFLQAARPDGAAGFVGIERVTGQLGGRRGTFLLQDAGTVQDGIVNGDWFVIAGSGTGELAGLRGEGGFRANLGQDAEVHLDYWFELQAPAAGACLTIRTLWGTSGAEPPFSPSFCPGLFWEQRHKSRRPITRRE